MDAPFSAKDDVLGLGLKGRLALARSITMSRARALTETDGQRIDNASAAIFAAMAEKVDTVFTFDNVADLRAYIAAGNERLHEAVGRLTRILDEIEAVRPLRLEYEDAKKPT